MKDWHREAIRLRAEGLSYPAIAYLLKRSSYGVWAACNRERCNEYHRQWKRRAYGQPGNARAA